MKARVNTAHSINLVYYNVVVAVGPIVIFDVRLLGLLTFNLVVIAQVVLEYAIAFINWLQL